jgi:alanine racemase/tRNA threonylcarbamoyladenosine biosynthesis protein TsaE
MLDGVAESWLDVAIDRPTGAGADEFGAAEPGDDESEPRTVTVTGRGPRWAAKSSWS